MRKATEQQMRDRDTTVARKALDRVYAAHLQATDPALALRAYLIGKEVQLNYAVQQIERAVRNETTYSEALNDARTNLLRVQRRMPRACPRAAQPLRKALKAIEAALELMY